MNLSHLVRVTLLIVAGSWSCFMCWIWLFGYQNGRLIGRRPPPRSDPFTDLKLILNLFKPHEINISAEDM